MRIRVIRMLAAITACIGLSASGVLAAGSAGASTVGSAPSHQMGRATRTPVPGPVVYTKNMAGYVASGRDFRYIQSLITVPDWKPTGLEPHEYIQLTAPDQWVRIGITYTQHFGHARWATFIAAKNNGLFPVRFYMPREGLRPGDGVFFSIYYDPHSGYLHFLIAPPKGKPDAFNVRARGPIFNQAAALDDWTFTCLKVPFCRPAPLPPFVRSFRINQFLRGALTTYSGIRGSFTGPWVTSKVVATSNGRPAPVGTVRVAPGPLFSDGAVANGAVRANDAFGVFVRG